MAGRNLRTFTVLPHLPERLQALHKLAYNLWWCWNHDAVALFRRIDADLFETVENSPVKLLGAIDQARARATAARRRLPGPHGPRRGSVRQLHDRADLVSGDLRRPRRNGERPAETAASPTSRAEFGIHESVPIYSGGLGVLAGDHLKSASDLGLPLVGVGLMYREGYFRQYLNVDGWQQERYPGERLLQPAAHPRDQAATARRCSSACRSPAAKCCVRIWRIQVGRVPLYLLDTNIPQNNAGGPQHHRPALRRRPRHAHPPGDGPGHRRRPRPARPGQAADRLPHERGPLAPSAAWSASASLMEETSLDFATRPRGRHRRHRASPRTRRCRPATTSSPRS